MFLKVVLFGSQGLGRIYRQVKWKVYYLNKGNFMGLSNEISFILIFLAVFYLWIKTLDWNLPMRYNMSVSVNNDNKVWQVSHTFSLFVTPNYFRIISSSKRTLVSSLHYSFSRSKYLSRQDHIIRIIHSDTCERMSFMFFLIRCGRFYHTNPPIILGLNLMIGVS